MAATAKKSPKESWAELLPIFSSCNLAHAKKIGLLRDALDGKHELGINLDQDVAHTPLVGKHLPCILASISHMWAVNGGNRNSNGGKGNCGRPFTGKDRFGQTDYTFQKCYGCRL